MTCSLKKNDAERPNYEKLQVRTAERDRNIITEHVVGVLTDICRTIKNVLEAGLVGMSGNRENGTPFTLSIPWYDYSISNL